MIKINKSSSKRTLTLQKILNSNFFSYSTRQKIIVVFIYFFIFLIVAKLINLQIFQHSNKDKFVNDFAYKKIEELQQRGDILDRNKEILVMSIKTYDLAIDAGILSDLKFIENLLSKYDIKLSSENYEAIKNKKRYISIKKDISYNTIYNLKQDISKYKETNKQKIKELRKLIKKNKKNKEIANEYKKELENAKKDKVFCLIFKEKYKRVYPQQTLASHIIGKVDADGIGTYGIERTCNDQLCGEKIIRDKLVINNEGSAFVDSISEEKIEKPKDVILTIDKKLQFIVEEELKKGLEKTKSKRGVAIIQNPNNGEILAMACFPNYNPSEPVSKIEYLKNTAIGKSEEPGSTFKIIVLAAVLQEGLFNLTDRINCENGSFQYAGKPITDHEKQRIITVQQILERSSNVGTAKLAIKLGEEKFYKYIRDFGFNSFTGIELTGEEKGILAKTSQWSKRSLPTLSFGQELFVTPLQTIGAYSVIANGGTLLRPKIIKAIGNEEYNEVKTVRKDVVSEETAYKVRQALEGVVKNGTGKSAKVPGYSVGGKTGTAQKFDPKLKQYSKKKYIASFCGMLPIKKPEIVILVIYDEPAGDYYASSVTAPVFAKIAQRAAEYLKIEPDIVETKIKKGAKK